MKITAFDVLYPNRLGSGDTVLVSSNGSNATYGGDVLGEPGDLSVVGLRSTVSLSSNLSTGAAIGDVLTVIQTAGTTVARFATPSNSYGSNATRVSQNSSSGAATSMSRSDHIHDGIGTVTASSSNTLQRGTFNLRAGNNISFGLTDSDGTGELDTVTIHGVPAAGGGGGGSGVTWVQDVNESGASYANWTTVGGTWSSNGTEIIQTDTTAAWRLSRYTSAIAFGWPWIIETEMYSVTSGGDNRAGIGVSDGTTTSALLIAFQLGGTNTFTVERLLAANLQSTSMTLSSATWYKVRVVSGSAGWLSIYVDGVLKQTTMIANTASWPISAKYLSLFSYNASVKFRNVKLWTLTGSAPA